MAQTLQTSLNGPEGCLNTPCPVSFPEEGHVLAPWVAVRFIENANNTQSTRTCITVSNRSTPPGSQCPTGNDKDCGLPDVPKNCNQQGCNAVIKDFEFGHGDGFNCSVRIIDQEGSEFAKFMENILSNHKDTGPPAMNMIVRYGWVREFCDTKVFVDRSDCFYMFLDSVDASFAGGKFLYTIQAKDLPSRMAENVNEHVVGDDGNPAFLVDGVRETLINEQEPPWVKTVKFVRMECDTGVKGGREVEIGYNAQGQLDTDAGFDKFSYDDTGKARPDKGIKDTWKSNSQDKLQSTGEWMAHHGMTKRGKQMAPVHENSKGGTVTWIEDIVPGCKEETLLNVDCLCKGTYIVNGGKDSRVIEFNPRIRWAFNTTQSMMGGGINPKADGLSATQQNALTDGVSGKREGKKDCPDQQRPEAGGKTKGGTVTTANTPDSQVNQGAAAALKTSKDQTGEQLKAWKVLPEAIEAELVIQGDPKLNPLDAIKKSTIATIFINPYYIMPNGDCGDWIVDPVCNEILTNSRWFVRGLSHRIGPGSYTTTIRIFLPAPHIDLGGFANTPAGAVPASNTGGGASAPPAPPAPAPAPPPAPTGPASP